MASMLLSLMLAFLTIMALTASAVANPLDNSLVTARSHLEKRLAQLSLPLNALALDDQPTDANSANSDSANVNVPDSSASSDNNNNIPTANAPVNRAAVAAAATTTKVTSTKPTNTKMPSTTATDTKTVDAKPTAIKTADARSTDTVKTGCDNGICTLPSTDTQCISMKETYSCKQFTDYYLPTNIGDFLEARWPTYKSENVKHPLNSTDFDQLFTTGDTSYFGKYRAQYSAKLFACDSPHQRWYKTSMCLDVLQFYRDQGDVCAMHKADNPAICSTTFAARAQSIEEDLKNTTVCDIVASNQQRGLAYADKLRRHPWSSQISSCISGEDNEESDDAPCGWSPLAACDKGCSTMTNDRCATLRAAAADSTSSDDNDDSSDSNLKSKPHVLLIVWGTFGGIVLLTALVILVRIRSRSAKAGVSSHSYAPVPVVASLPQGTVFIPLKEKKKPASSELNYQSSKSAVTMPNVVVPMQEDSSYHNQQPGRPAQSANHVRMERSRPPHTPQSAIYSTSPPMTQQPIHLYTVTVAYNAKQSDEIDMHIDDRASISQDHGDRWATGMNHSTGAVGMFPLTCFGNQR